MRRDVLVHAKLVLDWQKRREIVRNWVHPLAKAPGGESVQGQVPLADGAPPGVTHDASRTHQQSIRSVQSRIGDSQSDDAVGGGVKQRLFDADTAAAAAAEAHRRAQQEAAERAAEEAADDRVTEEEDDKDEAESAQQPADDLGAAIKMFPKEVFNGTILELTDDEKETEIDAMDEVDAMDEKKNEVDPMDEMDVMEKPPLLWPPGLTRCPFDVHCPLRPHGCLRGNPTHLLKESHTVEHVRRQARKVDWAHPFGPLYRLVRDAGLPHAHCTTRDACLRALDTALDTHLVKDMCIALD